MEMVSFQSQSNPHARRECGFLGPGKVPVMMKTTLDICIRLDGVGSISYTFPRMDSHDSFGGGGRGGRLSRLRETEVGRGAKGCLVEESGGVKSQALDSYHYYVLLQSVKKLGRNLLLNSKHGSWKSHVLLEICDRIRGDGSHSELPFGPFYPCQPPSPGSKHMHTLTDLRGAEGAQLRGQPMPCTSCRFLGPSLV